MEYRLLINEETLPVEVDTIQDNKLSARVGEKEYDVSFSRVSDNQIHLNVDGRSVNAYVIENSSGKTIMLNGKSFFVQDAHDIAQSPVKKTRANAAPTTVTPPMPAVVVSVLVKPGDEVEKGTSLVVVSAMKMDTSLTAPYTGVVAKVNVQEGDKVMPGDILIDIDEAVL